MPYLLWNDDPKRGLTLLMGLETLEQRATVAGIAGEVHQAEARLVRVPADMSLRTGSGQTLHTLGIILPSTVSDDEVEYFLNLLEARANLVCEEKGEVNSGILDLMLATA